MSLDVAVKNVLQYEIAVLTQLLIGGSEKLSVLLLPALLGAFLQARREIFFYREALEAIIDCDDDRRLDRLFANAARKRQVLLAADEGVVIHLSVDVEFILKYGRLVWGELKQGLIEESATIEEGLQAESGITTPEASTTSSDTESAAAAAPAPATSRKRKCKKDADTVRRAPERKKARIASEQPQNLEYFCADDNKRQHYLLLNSIPRQTRTRRQQSELCRIRSDLYRKRAAAEPRAGKGATAVSGEAAQVSWGFTPPVAVNTSAPTAASQSPSSTLG